MDKPLKSVMHGQCDARPTVTLPAAGHHTLDQYKIAVLGDSGTSVRTTCQWLLPESRMART